jgi:hypothetical protein
MVVVTASPQNIAGMPLLFNRLHAIATTDWFLRSMMPFCCGVYGTVCYRSTPCSVQYVSNSMEVNSAPLSIHSTHKCLLVSTSTFAWNFFMTVSMLLLAASSATHMNLLLSSIRSRKNFLPPGSPARLCRTSPHEQGPAAYPPTHFSCDGNRLLFILMAIQSVHN